MVLKNHDGIFCFTLKIVVGLLYKCTYTICWLIACSYSVFNSAGGWVLIVTIHKRLHHETTRCLCESIGCAYVWYVLREINSSWDCWMLCADCTFALSLGNLAEADLRLADKPEQGKAVVLVLISVICIWQLVYYPGNQVIKHTQGYEFNAEDLMVNHTENLAEVQGAGINVRTFNHYLKDQIYETCSANQELLLCHISNLLSFKVWTDCISNAIFNLRTSEWGETCRAIICVVLTPSCV